MPFRRVADIDAGPLALGILAPPTARTLLILRPRELPWDLVATATLGSADFLSLDRHEAALQAQRLFRALETGPVSCQGSVRPAGLALAVSIGEFGLLLCDRVPGRPYAAAALPDEAALARATARLLAVLSPGEQEQEVYFNTAHFQAT